MRSKILKIFQNIINIYVPHEIKKSNLLKMIPTVVKSSTFLNIPSLHSICVTNMLDTYCICILVNHIKIGSNVVLHKL